MRKEVRSFLVPMVLILALQSAAARGLQVPKLEARVTDLAGVLTPEQAGSLESKLKQFETSDSTQIAVLIIPSLEGEELADYSVRVASAWRLGQKGRDNGALLLIAMKERKVRIEVGYGLEPKLTDALSRRIIENEIVPNFRRGDFYQGVDEGVSAIIEAVRGMYQPGRASSAGNGNRGRSTNGWSLLVFLLVPMLWILGTAGKWGGGILGGGAGAYLLYSLMGFTLVPMLAGAAIGSVFGVFLGSLVKAGTRPSTRGRWGGGFGGPFFPGGGISGGGFGGGGFGGGFSGGGGSFGGGGASGSW